MNIFRQKGSLRTRFGEAGIIHMLPLLLIIVAIGMISFLLISSTAPIGGLVGKLNPKPDSHAATSNCGLANAIFCYTFDSPSPSTPGQNRTGDLDSNVWGVSRTIGGVNWGQSEFDAAPATYLLGCNGNNIIVRPPNDVVICNGQLHEATNDNPGGGFEAGGVTALAIYPKQPFDFAGRTGIVAFDISNDNHGTHSAWPEFWMSDLPVPVPFNHFDSWIAVPKNGFGLRFAAGGSPGQFGTCPTVTNTDRWTVDSGLVSRNYVWDDYHADYGQNPHMGTPSQMAVQILDCVTKPPDNSGIMNHVEIHVSQNQIDVYATDAGTTAPLKHIAVMTNANLQFSRGLIWLEDVHYNADKGGAPSEKQHTFIWDNVAFDGPFTYRDFSYDALDANTPAGASSIWNLGTSTGSNWNLGKLSGANQTASWNVLNIPANPAATAVRVLYNFFNGQATTDPVPTVLNVIVNGHSHPTPWPYPDTLGQTWRTFAVTIPITDLIPGTNVVQLGADQTITTANVNIVLVDVPGGVPVLPGSVNTYPGATSGPTSTPNPVSSPTPVPTPTPTATPGPTSTPIPGNTTTVDDSLMGSGLNQFNYQGGGWGHCANCGAELFNGSNSWNNIADESVTFQFNGQQAAFYGVMDPSEGMGAFSVDNGAETMVNFFASTRAGNQLMYTTPVLSPGTHTLKLRVTGTLSGGTTAFVTADRVDVISSVTSTPTPIPTGKVGDINGDGKVDIFDYNLLVGNFGKSGISIQGDLNNDNTVNIFDYNLLVGNFGK